MSVSRLLAVSLIGLSVFAPFHKAYAQAPAAPAPAAVAAPEVTTPPAATASGSKSEMNLFNIITRSGWFGIMIWLMLIACLIVCVALVVDSYLTIREKEISPPAVVESVRSAINEGDIVKAIDRCNANPGALSKILLAGFGNAQEGFEVIQDSVSVAADIESEKLLSRVTYLSVISNTTPMLGLIGTVQGMIFAFHNLGTTEAGAAQQSMLAINISHGLWATAVGLATAVPATIYFFYFKNKATKIILGMEAMTLDIIKSLRNVEVVEG